MASVCLKNVHKSYDDAHIVKGVSLEIESGEFLVLVGPSGCGKSTTLRMIAGLEEISSGDLLLDGERINDRPPKDRDIGMVFQSYALYPHMTVKENIAFGLRLRKEREEDILEAVSAVAEMLGLKDYLSRKPGQLSGGQRQRVAMGRAIARKPKVFLFDEPLSNLDAALRVQMRTELARLHKRLGTTMVYVTHDQVEAMTLATRIAVLNEGILQQVGTPMELYKQPANDFVAGFIGSPAINFLSGQMEVQEGQTVFSSSDLKLAIADASDRPDVESCCKIGIRPHDAEPIMGAGENESRADFQGVVEMVERMGWESFAHLAVGQQRFVVRLEGEAASQVSRGDTIGVRVPRNRLHLFDAKGVALSEKAEQGT
jgi:multiple sugar transport system ATP-binding protein